MRVTVTITSTSNHSSGNATPTPDLESHIEAIPANGCVLNNNTPEKLFRGTADTAKQ